MVSLGLALSGFEIGSTFCINTLHGLAAREVRINLKTVQLMAILKQNNNPQQLVMRNNGKSTELGIRKPNFCRKLLITLHINLHMTSVSLSAKVLVNYDNNYSPSVLKRNFPGKEKASSFGLSWSSYVGSIEGEKEKPPNSEKTRRNKI